MAMWQPGKQITIRKLKYQNGSLWMMWAWDETIWHVADEFFVTLETPGMVWARDDDSWVATRYAVFYIFPAEPFHFLELYAGEPPYTFDGWYCNINTPPRRTVDGLEWIDLDLDVWVYPDLTFEILDEDEYQENAARYEYTPEMHQMIKETVERLRERVRHVEFPFRPNVTTFGDALVRLSKQFGIDPPSVANLLP